MQNRMPSRRRKGNTVPAQGQTQERVPRLPHEHDESADSQRSGKGREGAADPVKKFSP